MSGCSLPVVRPMPTTPVHCYGSALTGQSMPSTFRKLKHCHMHSLTNRQGGPLYCVVNGINAVRIWGRYWAATLCQSSKDFWVTIGYIWQAIKFPSKPTEGLTSSHHFSAVLTPVGQSANQGLLMDEAKFGLHFEFCAHQK